MNRRLLHSRLTCPLLAWCAVIALACSSPAGGQAPKLETGNFANPELVALVAAGNMPAVSAAWWGFDRNDSTKAIQSAIKSKVPKVIIPYMGMPWIVGPIFLASNQEIIFEPGVVVLAREGEFHGMHDCLFSGDDVTHVTLRGYGAVLRMRKADYTGRGYTTSEFRHVVSFRGASDIRLLGLSMESSGGDGIYLGPSEDDRRVACRDVTIADCTCHDNHRQGISVVSAEKLSITNCTLGGTKGTAPQAGIDLEPSSVRDLMTDIEIRNCRAIGNAGSGFMTNLERQNAKSAPVSIRIVDCLVRNSVQPGLRALCAPPSGSSGFVEFNNCTVESVELSGARCLWNTASPIELRFVNCKFRDVARRSSEFPIDLELSGRSADGAPGGIRFADCYVYDDVKRNLLKTSTGTDCNAAGRVNANFYLVNGKLESAFNASSSALPGFHVELKTP